MDALASMASNMVAPLLKHLTYLMMLQHEEKEVRHIVEAGKRGGEEIEDIVLD
ncbi:hypothetical protein JHK82_033820 [Glycine max]|nr:hypothetical protein JHK86_033901 [Glycine max]KAG5119400.1 hypothetical protein JHK82_033820 [Glycine max]